MLPVLLGAMVLAAIAPSGAAAAPPESFWTRCALNSEADTACSIPRGLATAPASAGPGVAGNVFVADQANGRVVEFSPWGQFVRAFGWKVNKTKVLASAPESQQNVCPVDPGDECQAGSAGAGAGQFGGDSPQGVAVDSAGNVYVLDRGIPSNNRVQKFDPEGHFLRMFGGGVNSGTSGNPDLCTDAGPPTDVCKAGSEGNANGQFGKLSVVGAYIAVDTLGTPSAADDKVYVGDQERIQRFDANGAYQSQIALAGLTVRGLAVDPAGNLYASFCGAAGCFGGAAAKANVRKLSSAGVELGTVTVANPQALAAGPAGELFVIDGTANPTIRQFSSAGAEVPSFAFQDGFAGSNGVAAGSACLDSGYDLYVSNAQEAPNGFLRAYGPPPDEAHALLCPPPPHAPEIADQATLSVEAERATVRASINPKFWADTSYFVQYASAACIEAGGWGAACVQQQPAAPASLGAGLIDTAAKTAQVVLSGLTPSTEYNYRFAAESSGGGPVFGKGGSEIKDGQASTFTTYSFGFPPAQTNCPNQAFRSGPSAFLPDCRAYEMVSPLDKNGGDIGRWTGYIQATPDGDRITYSARPAFGDQPSSKESNQYLAARVEGVGWSNHGINSPLGRQLEGDGLTHIEVEAAAFSPDLCSEWQIDYSMTPLAPEAEEGYVNLYRQDLCGSGGFEALSRTTPAPGAQHLVYLSSSSVQGFSADAGHVLFVAAAGLTDDAAQGNRKQIYDYDRSSGELRLVSVMPSGVADPGLAAGAGVGGGYSAQFGGNLEHAVSADGSRVYWVSRIDYNPSAVGLANRLYLRENPTRPQSAEELGSATGEGDLSAASTIVTAVATESGEFAPGQTIEGIGIPPETTILAVNGAENKLTLSAPASASGPAIKLEAFSKCTEPERACTVAVSTGKSPFSSFWGADPNGAEALYSEGALENQKTGQATGTLYRFDAQTGTRTLLAEHFRGVLGTSEDLSRIYFVSTDALTGSQENSAGDKAQADEPNLYLEEDGNLTFIATLLGGEHGDVSRDHETYAVAFFNPLYNAARTTPDGAHIVFQSRAPVSGYDNTDLNNGEADVEVFTYEAGGALHCVSCRPSGARPLGRELTLPFGSSSKTGVWAAAWIPTSEHPLHASNVLSENGGRIFFNANDAVVRGDTNGVQDVYEWEAPGVGGCTKGSLAFHRSNGGCLYLISSGESPSESEFWEASADGRDVFFITASSLLPQDPGHIDLYDARALGGFAQPVPPPECEGEACQSAAAPPVDPTLSSASFKGAGNPKSATKPRCTKGKRAVRKAGKTRCVRKHKRAHKRNANHNRRNAR